LWGRKNGVWYRVDEYYFNSRTQGFQKTDEEHYDGLEKLIDGSGVEKIDITAVKICDNSGRDRYDYRGSKQIVYLAAKSHKCDT
jgi:hypothetical protein